jgi:hypothetical protein
MAATGLDDAAAVLVAPVAVMAWPTDVGVGVAVSTGGVVSVGFGVDAPEPPPHAATAKDATAASTRGFIGAW